MADRSPLPRPQPQTGLVAPPAEPHPRGDDAYVVGKIMDVGKQIADALAGANVKTAEYEHQTARIEATVEEKRIGAQKEQARDREVTLRIVVPLCVIGLFVFLIYALHVGTLKEAVAALPQLVVAFALVSLLWRFTHKKPKDPDDPS